MGKGIHLCSFSSTAANLKESLRHENGVLYTLKYYPRISTFDMSENEWLQNIIKQLEEKKLIEQVDESYPWHKWKLTEQGVRATIINN